MTTPPILFDRSALLLHRARVQPDALFLQQAAIDEVQDRLSMVNRSFTSPAVISAFPELWQNIFPKAQIIPDDDVLALQPGHHDLVIHALCLHWSNDPVGQLIQCRRALKEDGLLLVISLGGQTLHELRATLSQAEAEMSGGLSPRIAPMAEIRDLGALLQRAGFALPVADSLTLTAEYRDLYHLMRDLRAMGETNTLAERLKSLTPKSVFERANRLYSENFSTESGRLQASFELICLTGWSPANSQPQPLRPGSAQARLADALNTAETKLTD